MVQMKTIENNKNTYYLELVRKNFNFFLSLSILFLFTEWLKVNQFRSLQWDPQMAMHLNLEGLDEFHNQAK